MKRPRPAPPRGAPPGTVWYGGPIPWFAVTLSLDGETLDPDEVTRILGVSPDASRHHEARTPGRHVARLGRWALKLRSSETDEWDVAAAIELVLDRVPTGSAWEAARTGAAARLSLGLELDTANRELALPPDLLARLAVLGVSLELDIYGPGQPELADEPAVSGQ